MDHQRDVREEIVSDRDEITSAEEDVESDNENEDVQSRGSHVIDSDNDDDDEEEKKKMSNLFNRQRFNPKRYDDNDSDRDKSMASGHNEYNKRGYAYEEEANNTQIISDSDEGNRKKNNDGLVNDLFI